MSIRAGSTTHINVAVFRGEAGVKRHSTFFVIVFFCLGAVPALAQNAALVGTVRDAQQAIIPEATVTLRNADTGVEQTAKSNEIGNYEFPAVRPGNYAV